MKLLQLKNILILFLLTCLSAFAQAQTKFGFRLAPGISFTQAGENELNYDPKASGGKMTFGGSVGPVAEFFLKPTLSIGTGLWYTVKAANIAFNEVKIIYSYTDQSAFIQQFDNAASRYNLTYLQLPLTLKGYTRESASGIRLYAQVGGTFDVKIREKAFDPDQNLLYQVSQQNNEGKDVYKTIAISLYGGAGIEKKISSGKVLFLGLSYQHSMTNVMNSLVRQSYGETHYSVHPRLLALELGLKF